MITPKLMKTFMEMLMWVGPDLKEDVIKFWQRYGSYSGYKKSHIFNNPILNNLGFVVEITLKIMNRSF